MNDLLNNPPANGLGWISVFSTVFMWFLEKVEHLTVNDTIQFFVGIGGLVFIIFKIVSQILDIKIKKKQLRDE